MFGTHEHRISDAYRSIFLDIDALVEQMCRWVPNAHNILEVGCGEGAVTQRLRLAYPKAQITAIDITARIGRLYRGSYERVRFVQCTVQQIAEAESGAYDLAVLSDVLHHVPIELRQEILDAVSLTLKRPGTLFFKDWQRSHTPIHWLCFLSDRWLTGDRIRYMTREQMRESLARSFGDTALVAECRIAPWWNNIATLVRAS